MILENSRVVFLISALATVLTFACPTSGQASPDALPKTSNTGELIELGRSYTIHSRILDQDRLINVYLPPEYEQENTAFPVLYLLDGGVREDFLHIAGIAALAADWRGIRPFILVGIEGIDRYHDLLSPSAVESETQRLPTSGGSAAFRQFLTRELQPFVSRRFRTTDETALIGESVAGHFVVETLFNSPSSFQAYAAISPSLWWNQQTLSKHLAERTKSPLPSGHRIFLSIADEGGEMREAVDRVVTVLNKQAPDGSNWRFVPMDDETHATTFHPAALAAVRWIFATE